MRLFRIPTSFLVIVLLIVGGWLLLLRPRILFIPPGAIPARDERITALEGALARGVPTTESLPETVLVYARLEPSGEGDVLYRDEGEEGEVVVRRIRVDVPVEGTMELVVKRREGPALGDELVPELIVKRRGLCFRPKALIGFTPEESAMPGLGVRLAFAGDAGLAAAALWSRTDPEIMPASIGGEIDWRLRRLGFRNTAVGLGAQCDLEDREIALAASLSVFL